MKTASCLLFFLLVFHQSAFAQDNSDTSRKYVGVSLGLGVPSGLNGHIVFQPMNSIFLEVGSGLIIPYGVTYDAGIKFKVTTTSSNIIGIRLSVLKDLYNVYDPHNDNRISIWYGSFSLTNSSFYWGAGLSFPVSGNNSMGILPFLEVGFRLFSFWSTDTLTYKIICRRASYCSWLGRTSWFDK